MSMDGNGCKIVFDNNSGSVDFKGLFGCFPHPFICQRRFSSEND